VLCRAAECIAEEKPFYRLRRVCAMEGAQADFRAEFGRYFVCEAKDWAKSAGNFSEFAKFCSSARFGESKVWHSCSPKTAFPAEERVTMRPGSK